MIFRGLCSTWGLIEPRPSTCISCTQLLELPDLFSPVPGQAFQVLFHSPGFPFSFWPNFWSPLSESCEVNAVVAFNNSWVAGFFTLS